jgi:hypothetical protein
MNDDNDHQPIRYVDVAADYAAARKLGADPPEIPEVYLRHGNGFEFMHRWLTDHDMIGAHGRWLAEHGVALWCPDWCHDQAEAGWGRHTLRRHVTERGVAAARPVTLFDPIATEG